MNPSGKLPITFPQADTQLPRPTIPNSVAHLVPFDIDYFEGANVGYRWFELKNEKPLFPFGYGLSYTTFRIGAPCSRLCAMRLPSVSRDKHRRVEGAETVQVYAAPVRPERTGRGRLVGWSKVSFA